MTTFFLVKSNIKHNGIVYQKDTIIEGVEFEFGSLVTDGLLRVIPAVDSLAKAQEVIADEKEIVGDEPAEKEPENTWGPKKDEDAVAEDGDGLNTLNKKELLNIAKKEKVEEVKETTNKVDIIKAIRAKRLADAEPVENNTDAPVDAPEDSKLKKESTGDGADL